MFEKFEKSIESKIKKSLNEWLEKLKVSIDEKTPEDTKTLLGNNEIEKATTSWDYIVWKVFNETLYWIYVEYWVQSKEYNYNKPKWNIFYVWTWARMFTRWYDETKQEILNNIKKSVWIQ